MTPKEVGIFLQALGYPPATYIYIAAGEIFGGDTYLSDLRSRFPNLVFKVLPSCAKLCLVQTMLPILPPIITLNFLQETLATAEELEKFVSHASQAAAIDYIISVESDVFVPSYTGNMARAVEGHRRYLDHRKTINPDRYSSVPVL